MPAKRSPNLDAARWVPTPSDVGTTDLTDPRASVFGDDVFGPAAQRRHLSKDVYQQLKRTIECADPLDPALATPIAHAMQEWALAKGATHFSHWFQPLTGSTAEKHDSFFNPAGDGTSIADFSGKDLIQGEPDASSFPTGGIRATFEARGYTAWDPSSPAFIMRNPNGAVLCIPTAFASWTGEALDHKIPLLRSIDALQRSAIRALRLFGDTDVQYVFTTIGPEQEYFLIDEHYFYQRPDLLNTGRTLFGAKPPRGHELDDHYFGSIPERVLAYMLDVEDTLLRLGVPVKTRHNEVAPNQYELAPMFEGSNVGSDHQQLTMQVLQTVARRYRLVCLLHEKPFVGVNGSGKHNNWSMSTDTGMNLLDPADNPYENELFLFFCTAVVQAVNKHQGLLRATVASAGQDHRLGANEAPPAIMSVFLGTELESVFDKLAGGKGGASTPESVLGLGTPVIPNIPLHSGDRNRTSPFAFTGNKFEFRALGANQSTGFANTVLNTIVAEAIDDLCDALEAAATKGKSVSDVLAKVLGKAYKANRRIVFLGDNYSAEWEKEAKKRGLKNLRTSPEAFPEIVAPSSVEVFSRYGVLNPRELEARYEVWTEQYTTTVNIEAETCADIARTMVLPAALRHLAELKAAGVPDLVDETESLISEFVEAIRDLDRANVDHPPDEPFIEHAVYMRETVRPAMHRVRLGADALERIVADDLWPLPKYSEILFIK